MQFLHNRASKFKEDVCFITTDEDPASIIRQSRQFGWKIDEPPLRDRFKIEPAVVTGRATDNQVGSDMIVDQLQVAAFNALTEESKLGNVLMERLFPDRC